MKPMTNEQWNGWGSCESPLPNVRPHIAELVIDGWHTHETHPGDNDNRATMILDVYGLSINGANHFLWLPKSDVMAKSPEGWQVLKTGGDHIEQEKPDYDTLIDVYGFRVW